MSAPEVITLDEESDGESNLIVLDDESESTENNESNSEVDTQRYNGKFVCEICNSTHDMEIDFIHHKLNHTTYVFECSLCNRRSKTADNRNKHEFEAHKLDRPKEHRKTTRKLSPEWYCESCNFAYSSKSHFDNHERHKHMVHAFCCSLCTKKLATFSARNIHERKMHRYLRPIKFWRATCKVTVEKRQKKTVSHVEKHREFRSKKHLRVTHPWFPRQENNPTPDGTVQEPVRVPSQNSVLPESPTPPQNDRNTNLPPNDSSSTQTESTLDAQIPFIDTVEVLTQLSHHPTLIYYDFEMLKTQFGPIPVNHWRQHCECKILLVRFAGSRGNGELNIGTPIWKLSMPRYENQPETSRSSYLLCFVKDGSSNLIDGGRSKMNIYMNFQNLLTEFLPALQVERSLVLASNHDRQWVRYLSFQSNNIFIL